MAVLLLFRIPLLLCLAFKVDAAIYRTRPQPTAALLGQTVTLRCSFYNLRTDDVVNWFGPPEFQHISAARNVHSRYTRYAVVDSNADAGEFNLEIRNVQQEDDGIYRCSTFYAENAADARLTVVVPPVKRPEMIIKSDPPTVGQALSVICRSSGGRPAPKLTWYNGTHLVRQPVHGWNRGRKTLDGQSVLMLPVLTKWDNGMNLTCKADQGYPDLVEPGIASTVLNVQYPPTIQTQFDKVDVLFGNTDYSLECKADGNPKPKIRWRRTNTNLYFSNPLRFSKSDYQTEGDYECVAESLGFPTARRQAVINVIGRPDIRGDPETIRTSQGTSVTLLCEVNADPPISSISWFWRNDRGRQTALRKNRVSGVSIRQRATAMGTDSILVIDSVGTGNAGEYSCKAANMFGEDSRDFTIVVEENMPTSNGTKPLPPPHPKETSMMELEDFGGTMKPRPPPKGEKDLYAIGVNYPKKAAAILGVILAILLVGPATLYRCRKKGQDLPNNIAPVLPLQRVSDMRVSNINHVGQGGNIVMGDLQREESTPSEHHYEEIKDDDVYNNDKSETS
uniref:Ig-like domain-containing protein n=1 Tax=Branchiostoma floridae TaxID=7739 RepID=C3ZTQ0_BRAFL|eukprot:XP_002588037.1 hypothetical protein BRAFLDRAFT_83017 [Branchiostoma floridae]